MRILLIIVGLIILLVCGLLYRQYSRHENRLQALTNNVYTDDRSYRAFQAARSELAPTMGAYDHSVHSLFGQSYESAADAITFSDKLKHVEYEQHKIDRNVMHLQSAISEMHRDFGTPEKRDIRGELEFYWRSSDDLHEAINGLRGLIQAGLSNPFVLAGSNAEEAGRRVGESLRTYDHTFQTMINIEDDTAAYLYSKRSQDQRLLNRENEKWLLSK